MADQNPPLKLWQVPLVPLSFLYAAAVRVRNAYYRRVPSAVRRVGVPVISVGNLTVGGTGKTPLTIELARRLRGLGHRPAILTRGYAARVGEPADEVREFALAIPEVPVVVGADRVAGAERARTQHGVDCLVLDDGFQHRRLHRDLDIVVVDALEPWGGGRMLPAGRLREPLSGLRRADWFVISRANQVEPEAVAGVVATLERYAPAAPIIKAEVLPGALVDVEGRELEPAALAGRRVLPVCGLGNPRTFVNLVVQTFGDACPPMIYPDHHRYGPDDVEAILAAAHRHGADAVVTTRKDWVKLHVCWSWAVAGGAVGLYRLDVSVALADPQNVDARLARLFEERR